MYLAHYEIAGEHFMSGIVEFHSTVGFPLPAVWVSLLAAGECSDFGIRTEIGEGQGRSTLLASAREDSAAKLEAFLENLVTQAGPTANATFVSSAKVYDVIVQDLPTNKYWLSHRGYHAQGQTLVSDFRLFPLAGQVASGYDPDDGRVTYQINMRSHRPEAEDIRRVRKFIAAQRLDSPFPAGIRELVIAIAGRLLRPGFLIDEFIGASTSSTALAIRQSLQNHFHETMGQLGFTIPPLEESGFEELLITGRHSTRFDPNTHYLVRAATCLSRSEAEQLLRTGLPSGDDKAAGPRQICSRNVFISYSSHDYPQAAGICRHLEAAGIACWMAPRDIQPGDPYPSAIIRAIESARALVVVLSESSNFSPHVHREIECALNRKAFIVPMRIQSVIPSGTMEYLLSTLQWLEAHSGRYQHALQELVTMLDISETPPTKDNP